MLGISLDGPVRVVPNARGKKYPQDIRFMTRNPEVSKQ
jgi:hypothetical protein